MDQPSESQSLPINTSGCAKCGYYTNGATLCLWCEKEVVLRNGGFVTSERAQVRINQLAQMETVIDMLLDTATYMNERKIYRELEQVQLTVLRSRSDLQQTFGLKPTKISPLTEEGIT